jgi:flagellar protein FliS
MNHHRNAISAYQSAVMTTPPLQAVVLLYDGILVRIHNAGTAAAHGDYGRQYDETQRAVEILRGLLAALDLKGGGTLAEGLADTYRVNMRALMACVGRPDSQARLARIAEGLGRLRDAWAEIAGVPVRMSQAQGHA